MKLVLAVLLLGACYGRDNPPKAEQKAVEPPAPPAAAATPAPAAAPAGDEVAGTVFQTMNASEYTYALLDHQGKQVWVAGPQTQLDVGTVIGPTKGTLMRDFHSTTLNRTFDQIYFVSAFPVAGGTPANPHTNPRPTETTVAKVEPAPGGTTVAQIYADRTALAGKPVVVRGKVTKVNTGILGRTWVHLQDGTGAPGSNDLMVTTNGSATVGDVVVVRGKVAVDQDFGGGYRYAVLVEEAELAAK